MERTYYIINNEIRIDLANMIFISKAKYPFKPLFIEKTCVNENNSHNIVAFYVVKSLEDLKKLIIIESNDDQREN